MKAVREVLRQKWVDDRSHREVAASVGISIGAVSNILRRAQEAGLDWPAVAASSEEELEVRVYGARVRLGEAHRPEPDLLWIHAERQKTGVTLELLHEEYRLQHPDGLGRTQFCDRYRRWLAKTRLSMRQVHKAGDKLFVDYSGKKPRIVDPETHQLVEVELFVAVLGASSWTYAECTRTQSGPDFIASHVRALEALGGSPAAIVPDQLKSGVTTACWYDPKIQRTYQEMAEHYGCAVLPARPKRPKDKAKVERGVQLIQRWILARIRNETFGSLEALNDRIAELLVRFNAHPMRSFGGQTRDQRLEEIDRSALKPLPEHRFEYAEWKKARVNIDYHIQADAHLYSVPYSLVREDVEVRLSASTLEVFHRGTRVASHRRSFHRHGYTTRPEHMPKAHLAHLEWPPSRLIAWAKSIGPETGTVVETILARRLHPEQGYRPALGILRLEKKFGRDRLERAAARANASRAYSYKSIEAILRRGLDRLPLVPAPQAPLPLPIVHENLRGAGYYERGE